MFWRQLVNGLTAGATYALVALGYTLVFGVLEIIKYGFSLELMEEQMYMLLSAHAPARERMRGFL